MIEQKMEEGVEVLQLVRNFYKKRKLIFGFLILVIGLSIAYSSAMFLLNPAEYIYTSQSVIDMTITEEAEYQQPIFIAYLGSEKVFVESAKSIGLDANYALWRNSMVIEKIKDTNQIVFRISASQTDRLAELNRRIVSNTIFQTSNVLTGINVQTLEEAVILEEVKEIRKNVNYLGNLFIHITLGLVSIIGWITFLTITDKRIKCTKDIEGTTGLTVIGTIPDFGKLKVTEEMNFKNFLRGLTWNKKK